MTPEQFAYWLQGYVEINGEMPTKEQWEEIKNHLNTVFHKVTPVAPQYDPQHDSWKDPITGGHRIIC